MLYENNINQFLSENMSIGKLHDRRIYNEILSEEESKVLFTDKIVATMYQLMMNKYVGIDFGTIPNSKGSIEKLKEYETITKCMDAIGEVAKQNSIVKEYYDILSESISVLIANTRDFTLGFIQENEMIQSIYNTIVVSIISGINFTITYIVDYIITPNGDFVSVVEKRKHTDSKDYVLFKNLKAFNKTASDGSLKKLFTAVLKNNQFIGALSIGSIGVISIVSFIAIVPIMRELIYFIFNLRMSMSEKIRMQSEFLELNIVELKSNNHMSEKEKTAIIKKQRETIKKLNKMADKFELDFSKSNVKTHSELEKKVVPSELKTAVNDIGFGDNSFGLV